MGAEEKINILVVDDLPENLLAIQLILEELGQNVVTARSGREALRCLLDTDFAVILLDVNMPGMDGFETAALIRQRKRSRHTPIIFVTAFQDEMHTAQGYSLGAVDYILTPVIPEVLRTKVSVFADLFKKSEQIKQRAEERVALAQEQAARAAAEEVTGQSLFLAEAGMQLVKELDLDATVRTFLRLAVPYLADLATVTIFDERGQAVNTEQATAPTGADKPTEPVFASSAGRASLPPVLADAVDRALGSGTPVFLAFAEPQTAGLHLDARPALPLRAVLALVLRARRRTLGVVTLALGPSGRTFDAKSQALAEDLAGRAAIAVDNARLYRDIQERDRQKTEFLAMLAHELRNPLAPIRNAIHVMQLGNSDRGTQQWAKEVVERQVQQLVRLVDDLLDVSRITRGKIQLRTEIVDVAGVVARAVETSRPLIDARKHELTVSLPEGPVQVDVDPTRLAQVLANLLNNAAKYTEPQGRIYLSVAREEQTVVFRVRDNGIGIAAEMLPRVFDMFTQVEHGLDRSQGGLGIGLTLARRLIELHGGSVEAYSAGPDQGSEFVVRLPAVSEHKPAKKPVAHVHAHSNSCPHFRILVVDDNVDAAESLAVLLRKMGQEVQTAYDGPAALATARDFDPEVVFLDIGLPGLDGYEVAKKLRAKHGPKELVLVALTGYGQKEDRLRANRAGFDHHLVKPIVAETLPELLASFHASSVGAEERLALAEVGASETETHDKGE